MRLLLSIFLLLLTVSPASAQWSVRPMSGGFVTIYGAHFLSAEEGWLVGNRGTILHTSDGGNTWERGTSRTERGLNDVYFVDARKGWIVGDGGVVLHTVDSGANWRLQPSGTSRYLNAVHFVNSEEGWAVGGRGTILHTENGGNSWKPQISDVTESLRDVAFVNAEEGWVVGMMSTILHTADGGRTWEAQEGPGSVIQLTAIHFTTESEGWIVGSRGTIMHTEDRGTHWQQMPGVTRNTLQDITFVSPEEGWAVGGGGAILHTMDGGWTWSSETETAVYSNVRWMSFRRAFFFGRDHGLFVDRKGALVLFSDVTDLTVPTDMVARALYVVGGAFSEGHPWGNFGIRTNIDVTAEPGWILPTKMGRSVNLAQLGRDIGGRMWTTWPEGPFSGAEGVRAIDGDPTSGYVLNTRDTSLPRSGTLFLDLGAPFRVDKVVLRPITGFSMIKEEDEEFYVLQRVEIGVNDGNPKNVDGAGNPILSPVWGDLIDSHVTFPGWRMNALGAWDIFNYPGVEVKFPTEIARYVGITVLNAEVFSLGEIEVYGRDNFVPTASYVSDIIDFGDVASFGEIRWDGETDPGARVVIRTRSGEDDAPDVYWRITGVGRSARRTNLNSKGEPLTREGYDALKENLKAGITTDRDHWSAWSEPYDFEAGKAGLRIVSPEPRRYFQFRIDLLNTPTAAGRMDYLAFEYSSPPSAHELFAEIHPVDVKPAEVTTFVYSIKPTILGDDVGFDTLEILTPVPVDRIRAVRVDGAEIPFTYELLTDPTRFAVHFRHFDIRDSWGLLEVVFDSVVLRYGTEFVGRVYDSTSDVVDQTVVAGDVREDFDGNEITVNTELDAPLIESVEAMPNPFTPNADGVNDEMALRYTILKLTETAPLSIDLYTLSGTIVRSLYVGHESSGIYSRTWDGRDDVGNLLPPGIYVYRIRVRADAGVAIRLGTVTMTY